jgi:aminoglycoside/choline kinase family phosphotransferase
MKGPSVTNDQRQPGMRDARERLESYLTQRGLKRETVAIVPLTGDASDRKYFRVVRRAAPAIVLAVNPEAFDVATLPFARVSALLAAMPVPVPEILDHAGDLGVLSLQDLGDVTLQAYLGAVEPGVHVGLYRIAVSYIEIMQRRGAELASPDYPPYGIAFDVDKLVWELEFFTRHFVEGYKGARIDARIRAALTEEWQVLAAELAGEPRVLCHRDYHSRNLMLSSGELYVIDFQDARMGPDTYDLASLLRDSYVDLTEETVQELISHFIAQRREGAPAAHGPEWESDFRRRFDVMALQRNLKALGTFGYQTAERGNPVYIQYIPRTLRYARDNMARNPRFERLHGALAQLVDDFA